MRKHAEDPDGMYYRAIDRTTGKEIPFVVWADDETGEYEQLGHTVNPATGRAEADFDYMADDFVRVHKTGSIRLVDIREEEVA